jgi:dTDP-4-amino-4,6-dideoxygalactose transaminase
MTVPPARLVFSESDRARILASIDQSLQTGSLTLGPNTARFEELMATRHGAAHAIATNSGTSAIEIILRAIDVHDTDVVVPANTFYATAGAVAHAGGRPVFADIAYDTFALTAASVEAALTPTTSTVVLVHIGGVITPEVDAIRALCDAKGLRLVEDAAHAHGASFDGRPAGSFGVAAAFSFYPTKVITSAEGGMILTADEKIRDEARVHRDQGKAGFFGGEHVRMGYAWRLSELQASVGVVQTEHLDEFIAVRRAAAARYDEALASIPGITAVIPPEGCFSNYYKYSALLDEGIDRNQLKKLMRERHGIGMSGEVYARPLHLEPIFAGLDHGPLPVAEDVCARHVCLPVHSDMTEAEARLVIDSLSASMADLI